MSSEKLLEIKNLTVHFESFDATVHAVENLNLSLRTANAGPCGRNRRGQNHHGQIRDAYPAGASGENRFRRNPL